MNYSSVTTVFSLAALIASAFEASGRFSHNDKKKTTGK